MLILVAPISSSLKRNIKGVNWDAPQGLAGRLIGLDCK